MLLFNFSVSMCNNGSVVFTKTCVCFISEMFFLKNHMNPRFHKTSLKVYWKLNLIGNFMNKYADLR